MNNSRESKTFRIIWIDNIRGFVMFGTVLVWLLPRRFAANSSWLLQHPADALSADAMTLPDVGILAYLVIMGMMIRYSFLKHQLEKPRSQIVWHLLKRYFLLAMLAVIFNGFGVQSVNLKATTSEPFTVFVWGSLYTLALCGLLGSVLAPLSGRVIFALAFALGVSYQYILQLEHVPQLILHARFGGPIGTVLGFLPAVMLSFLLADLLFKKQDETKPQNTVLLLALCVVMIALAFFLHDPYSKTFIFNMRLVTLPYLLTAGGIIVGCVAIFSSVFFLRDKKIFLLSSFGKNSLPIFIYLLCEQRLARAVGSPDDWPWAISHLTFVLFFALWLDKRDIRLRL